MTNEDDDDDNTLTPGELAAIARKQSGENDDALTDAERRAIAPKRELSAKQLKSRTERQLKRQFDRQLERLKKPIQLALPPAPLYFGPPVRVGIDAEWVTLPDGKGGYTNEKLCITAVVSCGGKKSRYIHYVTGPRGAGLPKMASFIQSALRKAMKEGVVASLPASIVLFAHFMRGDLAAFADFWARKAEFRVLGKTLVSNRKGHLLKIDGDDDHVEIDPAPAAPGNGSDEKPPAHSGSVRLRDLEGRQFTVRIRFIDTIRLTPGGRGLAYAAQMVGRRKLDLHDDLGVPTCKTVERPERAGLGLEARYGKARMDLVMRDYPEAFEAYAFEDAEIALDYGVWMEKTVTDRNQFGLTGLPNTLASISAGVVRNRSGGRDKLSAMLGRTTETKTRFDEREREFRSTKVEVSTPGLAIYHEFACRAYHGGRSECFYHGPTDDRMWYDYDLPGAYTTALAMLRPVDHENIRQEFDADAFGIEDMGIAWVSFEFPAIIRFPCLPVRGEGGALIYPPEIFLARRMGATVTIHQGIIAPWKSETRIFEDFTRLVQSKRREYPKSTHPALNELWKEVGNSAYGLTAMGLTGKTGYDIATGKSQPIGESPLTEPFLAAWATGYIRAVLGEILWKLPESGTVISATTDGLLTDVPIEDMDLTGPLCSSFADIRERLFGEREVLDPKPKHGARQLVSVAVRTTFTAKPAEGFDLVCAKGSVKPPTRPEPKLQNQHMLKLYLGQTYGKKVPHEQLISAREQLTKECDLVGVKRERTLNLRYDFKRKPAAPRMVRLGRHRERIAWDTLPWNTAEEANFARSRVDAWSRGNKRLLRDMADYRHWESYNAVSWAVHAASKAIGVKAPQIRADHAAGIFMRVFLQAGRQGLWGVQFPPRSLAELANYLTDAGFPTGKEDITYAARRKTPLLEHCVPWVPETAALLRVILARFPDFDYRRAFEVADAATLVSFGFVIEERGGAEIDTMSEIDTAAEIAASGNQETAQNG